jgi:CheY-like chemotaxis protein
MKLFQQGTHLYELLEYKINGLTMEKIRILIAEDIIATINLYKVALSSKYFEKKFVINGEEALAAYKEWKPDILLLDIKMPVMSGYSVLKIIRGVMDDKDTVIIMSTSENTIDDVKSCAKYGIEGYILKPFKVRKIEDQVLDGYAKKQPERAEEIRIQKYGPPPEPIDDLLNE